MHSLGFGNGFLNMTPKAQTTQEKIDRRDFMEIKNFCAPKDTIKRVKRQHTKWEKIFANHIYNKSLKYRIHKELLKLNNTKTNNMILKWAKGGIKGEGGISRWSTEDF